MGECFRDTEFFQRILYKTIDEVVDSSDKIKFLHQYRTGYPVMRKEKYELYLLKIHNKMVYDPKIRKLLETYKETK